MEQAVRAALRNRERHRGKWLLIEGGRIIGVFDDYASARRAAMGMGSGLYVLVGVPEE